MKPLGNRVVIKQCDLDESTNSGIILTAAQREKPQEAIVIAVGSEAKHLKEGDLVLYSKYAGTDVKQGDDEFIIIKENDILAVLKGSDDE